MAFLHQPKFGSEKSERESNPVPYLEKVYFAGSAFLINLAASNKQSFTAKLALKSCENLVKVAMSCFKQLLLNMKPIFEPPYHVILGERLSSLVLEGTMLSGDKPLDFHATIVAVPVNLFKLL